jgi:hypothetical protein
MGNTDLGMTPFVLDGWLAQRVVGRRQMRHRGNLRFVRSRKVEGPYGVKDLKQLGFWQVENEVPQRLGGLS